MSSSPSPRPFVRSAVVSSFTIGVAALAVALWVASVAGQGGGGRQGGAAGG